MTDTPGVPADIQEMEKTVGQFIRSKGNPERPTLYAMLRSEEHHYTHRQVELWRKHYGHTGPVDEELKDIDAEAAVSQYRDDVESCASLGGGCKRLMKRLLSKGVCMTEHQARLALIQVKYAHLPNAHVNQWEEFTDILQQGQSMEDTICNIAEKRGWLVSLKNMRSMRSEYEKQLTVSELERRYHLGFWGRSHSGGGLGGFGRGPISNHVFVFFRNKPPPGFPFLTAGDLWIRFRPRTCPRAKCVGAFRSRNRVHGSPATGIGAPEGNELRRNKNTTIERAPARPPKTCPNVTFAHDPKVWKYFDTAHAGGRIRVWRGRPGITALVIVHI